MNNQNKTKYIAYMALYTALVASATIMAAIPIPATDGYINLGDIIILTVALSAGLVPALVAGGVGSAIADLVLGYAIWSPFSLIIKALEGGVAYLAYTKIFSQSLQISNMDTKKRAQGLISFSLGASVMVIGYYLASIAVLGSHAGALASIPSNLLQAVIGVSGAYLLVFVAKIGRFIK